MSQFRIRPTLKPLVGTVQVPGDKSISHRALLLGALAKGQSQLSGFLYGRDCVATLDIMRQLGIDIQQTHDRLTIEGNGLFGLKEPSHVLDCQNSGTTIRLLAGLLSAQPFFTTLSGSEQIRRRPMGRVIEPLSNMGARIFGRSNNTLAPLAIVPTTQLKGQCHKLNIASAQIKSAIALAGLYADGVTDIVEPGPSRDHTERMLRSMGASLESQAGRVRVSPQTTPLRPLRAHIPADPSSAAFLVAAAAMLPGSELNLTHVGTNPTRTGFLSALRQMGLLINTQNESYALGEPVADLHIQHHALKGQNFSGDAIVTMIDELPLIAVVATQAHGITQVFNAEELKVKETNRIETTVSELRKMGAKIEATADGFVVEGPTRLMGAEVTSHHDHRLAMALSIAALCAEGETCIQNAEVTDDSFVGFVQTLQDLGAEIIEEPS